MTREEQIYKAGLNCFQTLAFHAAFMRGANWADNNPKSPWISVNDALPDYRTNVILHNKKGNCIYIGARIDLSEFEDEDRVSYLQRYLDKNGFPNHGYKNEVDFWMPIPEIPNNKDSTKTDRRTKQN